MYVQRGGAVVKALGSSFCRDLVGSFLYEQGGHLSWIAHDRGVSQDKGCD